MSTRSKPPTVLSTVATALLILAMGALVTVTMAVAQQQPSKSAPGKSQPPQPQRGSQPQKSQPPGNTSPQNTTPRQNTEQPPRSAGTDPVQQRAIVSAEDAAKKNEILNSSQWRRAMFELNEWFLAQQIYTPQQVARIKSNLARQIDQASASELQYMLNDMEAKFKILDTKESQDVRSWMGHYLSILSDKKRDEVLKQLPNFVTMSADQLSRELKSMESVRQQMARDDAAEAQYQQAQGTNPFGGANSGARSYLQDHAMSSAQNYSSPYREPSGQKPFQDTPIGPGLEMYITPYGGAGVIYNPNRW